MIIFLYLFDEKCESVLSTFSIPLYKNEKKKKGNGITSYSRV